MRMLIYGIIGAFSALCLHFNFGPEGFGYFLHGKIVGSNPTAATSRLDGSKGAAWGSGQTRSETHFMSVSSDLRK